MTFKKTGRLPILSEPMEHEQVKKQGRAEPAKETPFPPTLPSVPASQQQQGSPHVKK